MQTSLRDGETLVKEGAANLQKGLEMVGGRLYLTSQRLVFEAHRLNVQGGVSLFERTQITGAEPGWSRLLGLLPVMPNLLRVRLADGRRLNFVVYGRHDWCAAIGQPA